MKIRTDFITNSSTTSFVAFVLSKDNVFSDDFYKGFFEKELGKTKKFYAEHPEYQGGEEEISNMEAMDEWDRKDYINNRCDLNELLEKSGLEVGGIENDWVGITVSTILNNYPDLKISGIRKMVADTINKEFNTDFTEKDIEYVEEAWRDG